MVFGFLNKDRRKAKKLATLANATIKKMEALLNGLEHTDQRRAMIEVHLNDRVQKYDRYEMLARGETDTMEQLAPTLRHFYIYERSMEIELEQYTDDADALCGYLERISAN